MAVQIQGGSNTAGKANVDAGYNLTVTLPTDEAYVGKAILVSENDAGSTYLASPETTDDFRLRVGVDSILTDRLFNYGAQDTGFEIYRNTTMTFTWSSLALNTNGSGITTTTTGASYQSQRSYPLLGALPLYVEAAVAFTAQPQTNTAIDFGLGTLATTNPYAPTDGVYFRLGSAGLLGVANYNGTEQTITLAAANGTGAAYTYTNNAVHRYVISITDREAEFWIDDVLYGTLTRGAANGTMMAGGAGNFIVRHAIAGGAAGGVISAAVKSFAIHQGDLLAGKPYSEQMNGSGRMPYQGMQGGTMGTTASYANSTNPTSAAGSNTAANITGLGGQGAINAAAGAATDFIACSYQVPAGAVATQTPRTLVVRGVTISTANMGAAVATTPTTLAWSLAFGHTAVSLATTEAATTKAPRRIPLGFQSVAVGAAIGALYTPDSITRWFDSPIYVNPGEFIACVVKQIVGTATASQSIWYHVSFDAYYE